MVSPASQTKSVHRGQLGATMEICLMVGATVTLLAFMFVRIADSYTLIQLQSSVAFTVLGSSFGLVARKLPEMRRVFGVTASAFAIMGLALFVANDVIFFVAFEQARRNRITPSATYWLLFLASVTHTLLVGWLSIRHVIATCCRGCTEDGESVDLYGDDDDAPVIFSRLDYIRQQAANSGTLTRPPPPTFKISPCEGATSDTTRSTVNRVANESDFY